MFDYLKKILNIEESTEKIIGNFGFVSKFTIEKNEFNFERSELSNATVKIKENKNGVQEEIKIYSAITNKIQIYLLTKPPTILKNGDVEYEGFSENHRALFIFFLDSKRHSLDMRFKEFFDKGYLFHNFDLNDFKKITNNGKIKEEIIADFCYATEFKLENNKAKLILDVTPERCDTVLKLITFNNLTKLEIHFLISKESFIFELIKEPYLYFKDTIFEGVYTKFNTQNRLSLGHEKKDLILKNKITNEGWLFSKYIPTNNAPYKVEKRDEFEDLLKNALDEYTIERITIIQNEGFDMQNPKFFILLQKSFSNWKNVAKVNFFPEVGSKLGLNRHEINEKIDKVVSNKLNEFS